MRSVLVVALACLAALPAAASGSTAKIVIKDSCNGDLACSKYNGGTPLPIVTYVAAAGEANRVAVARAGDVITISDPAATIAPEAPCQAVDPHQVACYGCPGAGRDLGLRRPAGRRRRHAVDRGQPRDGGDARRGRRQRHAHGRAG